MLSHIVAASENNIIGKDGELPWHLPNDFKYFKNKTYISLLTQGGNLQKTLHDDTILSECISYTIKLTLTILLPRLTDKIRSIFFYRSII